MSAPWKAAQVLDMPEKRNQFTHVVKHLYSKKEQWQQVTSHLGDPRCLAKKAGCTDYDLHHYDLVTPDCGEHVSQDYDEAYAPAYREALVQAEQEDRVGVADEGGWFFVGDNGVLVIVREPSCDKAKQPEVKTAYRVRPRSSEGKESEDFFKAAVRKLSDKTSWKGEL